MTRLNKTSKLSFYSARRLKGDANKIAEATGYSPVHVRYSITGHRSINNAIADEAFRISRRRMKTTEKLVNA